MQSETGFPSSHQLKSYVASESRLKLAARAVLSADAGLLVINCVNMTCCLDCFLCRRWSDDFCRNPSLSSNISTKLTAQKNSTSLSCKLMRVLSQDKVGGLQQEGHPA